MHAHACLSPVSRHLSKPPPDFFGGRFGRAERLHQPPPPAPRGCLACASSLCRFHIALLSFQAPYVLWSGWEGPCLLRAVVRVGGQNASADAGSCFCVHDLYSVVLTALLYRQLKLFPKVAVCMYSSVCLCGTRTHAKHTLNYHTQHVCAHCALCGLACVAPPCSCPLTMPGHLSAADHAWVSATP